jgi:hypothetical protein
MLHTHRFFAGMCYIRSQNPDPDIWEIAWWTNAQEYLLKNMLLQLRNTTVPRVCRLTRRSRSENRTDDERRRAWRRTSLISRRPPACTCWTTPAVGAAAPGRAEPAAAQLQSQVVELDSHPTVSWMPGRGFTSPRRFIIIRVVDLVLGDLELSGLGRSKSGINQRNQRPEK